MNFQIKKQKTKNNFTRKLKLIMPTQSQKNAQEIIKLQGEVRLVNQKMDTLINNHLAHLDTRINNINKILWLVLILGITSLADIIKTALIP